MNKKWFLKEVDSATATKLAEAMGIHPVTASILAGRGIQTPDLAGLFLDPKLSTLPSPLDLPDIEVALDRTVQAIQKNEKIAIFGDYDTDGVTSTALLARFFRACDVTVSTYIPNRLREGYGLSREGIESLHNDNVRLIITTDNGTSAHNEIELAKEFGIDVIVTDHHEVSSSLPGAIAVINPKRLASPNPFEDLAGVGVAFYFALALRGRLQTEKIIDSAGPDLRNLLDLVAVGTVADVAPLTGLNRTLVRRGIDILRQGGLVGFKSLTEAASTDIQTINATGIAFRISPRINAAGRLGNHDLALELLLTDDPIRAQEISTRLNQMNAERQAIEKKILEEAHQMVAEQDAERLSIVLWSENWHPGVIGIVAARLASAYRKPAVMISVENGVGRGSIRSVGKFNVMETLRHCSDLLDNFGGHPAAAGFDVQSELLTTFADRFEDHVGQHLTDDDRRPLLPIDAELDVSNISPQLIRELANLEPFGESNPHPTIATEPCTAVGVRIVGKNHLKLRIQGDMVTLDAIGFGLGDRGVKNGGQYRFAGTPEFNTYNGSTTIQFKIKDIQET